MIENTVKTEVEADPEELWERFLIPEELVRLIPGIKSVEDLGDGSYMVEVSVLKMDVAARVREKTFEKPEVVELESGDPYLHLIAEMEESDPTKVQISVKLDPPTLFGLLDQRIQDKLQERMERNVSRMKKEAERG